MDDFDDEKTAFRKDNVEKPEKDDDDEKTREVDEGERRTLTTRGTYRNLAGISVSFMLLFAAANSLQNVQSSINISEGLGTIGLMVIYFSVLLTGTFLPPLLFHRFGIKWAMIVSMSGYLAYAGAAFHATWVTIIPASVLVGTGLCILWVGKLAFISELAKQYSKTRELRLSNVLSRFYGLFFTVSYIGEYTYAFSKGHYKDRNLNTNFPVDNTSYEPLLTCIFVTLTDSNLRLSINMLIHVSSNTPF